MKPLSQDDLKKIIARRDRRYDSRFFFGVRTTHIYCRPICPAKPKPQNVVIFRSASEAEREGYRPCLRCRPDAAPGSKILDGTLNTVSRALRLIETGGAEDWDMPRLAAALGVSDRHLRRLFDEHLGATPIEIMVTKKLHFARRLVEETAMPMTEIAFAAGFQSIRRFNEAFKERFHAAPSQVRARLQPTLVTDGLNLRVPIHLPYDWETVLAYLTRHETQGIEVVEGGTYRRFLPHEDGFASLVVSHEKGTPYLNVCFYAVPLLAVRRLLARVRALFDADHNPAHLPTDGLAQPRGVRVPGSFDPFETAVAIILGQLVSTSSAKTTMRKLVEAFGRRVGTFEERTVYEFPAPTLLAEAPLEDIGMTRTKAGAIRGLAGAVAAGHLAFDAPDDFAEVSTKLLAIKGIGEWTASMIAMRCLGDPDAFPASDLILRRALERGLFHETNWAASRAYLTHCLWRDHGVSLANIKGVNV